MKKHPFLFFLLFGVLLIISGCGILPGPVQPTPTVEIYQPTRSVATLPPPTQPPACTNIVGSIEDVNYPDGTYVAPGTKFMKEWEVINYSDCVWGEGYHLYFISGSQMGAPDFVDIPRIPVGSRGKITVTFTAPEEKGEYRSEWKLFGADNRFFGDSLTVSIIVQ